MSLPHLTLQAAIVSIHNPLPDITVWGLVNQALSVVVPLAGVGFVIMFVYAGFTYIMSSGDAGKVKNAQAMMSNALIGLVIIAMAFVIQKLVLNAIG